MHSAPSSSRRPMHRRAPRQWQPLRGDPIVLPYPLPQSTPPLTGLFVSGASLLGGALMVLLLRSGSAGGGLGVGLLAITGTTAVASALAFVMQRRGVARANADVLAQYAGELDRLIGTEDGQKPGEAREAAAAEVRDARDNNPPLMQPDPHDQQRLALAPLVLDNPARLWQRRPEDPDFLRVRVGLGRLRPRCAVQLDPAATGLKPRVGHDGFRRQHERARAAVSEYEWLRDVPVTIPLREHACVAVVGGSPVADPGAMARALLGQVILHHSPREIHPLVIAPAHRRDQWDWARGLTPGLVALPTFVTGGSTEREGALRPVLTELVRREQALRERGYERPTGAPLPHLLIVLDAQYPDDVGQIATPAVELALRRGKELGVTVVALHGTLDQAPAAATLAVALGDGCVRFLWPDPPAPLSCSRFDGISPAECQRILYAYSRYHPEEPADEHLPAHVHMLRILRPPITSPYDYDIQHTWQSGHQELLAAREQGQPSVAIPLGVGLGGEHVTLDFVKDGPHGLLIGQTGSGKSQLLRSIIAGLAIRYSPEDVNFVLVDFKGGLELEVFAQLPHTLAMLTNLEQAGQIHRFLTMLESELLDRQARRKQGERLPRLFVIIDEFAEMVARRGPNDNSDLVLENLLRISRLGRALDVHLLFASQRPEGTAIAKLRGFVQYRISLRTATEDDSKEVIGRPDAAHLPLEIRGRGYILRGDHELRIFQAAQIAVPVEAPGAAPDEEAQTADALIALRMKPAADMATRRWAQPLPTPSAVNPTPLILALHGKFTPVEDAWHGSIGRPALDPLVVPLGLIDRPAERRREWFLADLHGHKSRLQGGPLLVMGDLNAGKTTTLQTLLLHIALHYSPREVRWYVLDPTGAFNDFAALPHSRDCLEPGQVNVIDGLSEKEFQAFKARFERAMHEDPARGRPRLLLVVDDYDDLASRYSLTVRPLLHELAQNAIRGRAAQTYLAISAARQTFETLPQPIVSGMANKIALYMSSRDNLAAVLGGRVPFVPDSVPGRGFAQTRSALNEIQVAAPVYGMTEIERLTTLQQVLERHPAAVRS